MSEPRAIDVWQIAQDFPSRWSKLMHQVYRADITLIMAVFHVSDRTARKWIAGDGGVNARHSTVAQLDAPTAYEEIILGRAA